MTGQKVITVLIVFLPTLGITYYCSIPPFYNNQYCSHVRPLIEPSDDMKVLPYGEMSPPNGYQTSNVSLSGTAASGISFYPGTIRY